MSDVVLATTSAAFEQRVRRAFAGDMNGTLRRWHDEVMLTDPSRAVKELVESGAEVVGVGPNVDVQLALELARAFDADRPEIPVIVITETTKGFWQKALRAGVQDVLAAEAPDEEIKSVFQRAIETSERRRANLLDGVTGGPAPAGKVITLVAPKGGSGKTALATNLALGLARGDEKVVLVDLDLQFGDVAASLSLYPENTIGELPSTAGLNATTLKMLLTPKSKNLFVLGAPDSPAQGEEVDERAVGKAVRLLSDEFAFVVIDTSAGLSEATLAAIELSTDLLLVCDLSAAAVRAMRKVIDALDRLGMQQQRRHFVLNRSDSRVGIGAAEAAAVVGLPIAASIPSARAVPLSMNQGVPILESSPRSPVGKSFLATAEMFIEAPAKRARWARSGQ